jgi:hypothetical protein
MGCAIESPGAEQSCDRKGSKKKNHRSSEARETGRRGEESTPCTEHLEISKEQSGTVNMEEVSRSQ